MAKPLNFSGADHAKIYLLLEEYIREVRGISDNVSQIRIPLGTELK